MSSAIFDQLLSPSTMVDGEKALLAMGENAVPLLQDLLDGTAKNEYGVAYRNLGLPVRCAVEVALRMGPAARPLEPLLVRELLVGSEAAARALGGLGSAEAETIEALAACLDPPDPKHSDVGLSFDAGVALIRLGASEHPSVLHRIEASKKASASLADARRYVAKWKSAPSR